MKIVKNIRACQKQDAVTKYGDETHVLLNERTVEIDNGDSTVTTQYEYDKVIVKNTHVYADVAEAARLFHDDVNKADLIANIIVTVTSGKQFYADPESRADLADAIDEAVELGKTSTLWKLPTGWETVTLDEIKEARRLGLQEKGRIVGIESVM